ncbi:MAG: RNA polymerase sigma factor [Saprospiraceae bacterium]|nr:RNA polymerase sigma factor [Lewinella sp.]
MVMHRRKEVDQLPDDEIIRLILHEDRRELMEVLYDRYAAKVYHKCLGVIGDKPAAQDLAHDVMLKIFLNLATFRRESDFRFWVYSITYNQCMDYLKKKKRLQHYDLDLTNYSNLSAQDIEMENKVLAELRYSQLERLLKELKEEDRLILLMRYQDSMPMKEIARILSITESAVKMRLRRSLDRLSERVKKEQHEE